MRILPPPKFLFIGQDLHLEEKLAPTFDFDCKYLGIRNTKKAVEVMQAERQDFVIFDCDLLHNERFLSQKVHLKELYESALHQNPKVVFIILFGKLSEEYRELKKKNFTTIMLPKKSMTPSHLLFIYSLFKKQEYRTIVTKDIHPMKKYSVDFYYYDSDNKGYSLICRKGEEFGEQKYVTLRESGHGHIYVRGPELSKLLLENILPLSDDLNHIRKQYKFFLSELFDHSNAGRFNHGKQLKEVAGSIVKKLRQLINRYPDMYECLKEIPYRKHSRISHGLNTAIFSIIFSKSTFTDHSSDLAIAALVHDAGSIGLPLKIQGAHSMTNKSVTDQIKFQIHVKYTLDLLEKKRFIMTEATKKAIEFHHEYFDGTGYPRGISGKEVQQEYSLFALCDVYDHILNDFKNKHRLSLLEAWEKIKEFHQMGPLKERFRPEIIDLLDKFFARCIEKDQAA
ncbi:MAG: HD domain-containing protein [Bacteriovoracaceae bacterium]|nr:HD domain-containing protein [Bacteriovoracaceae bacterium]